MKTIALKISNFTVNHLYRWILPIAATFLLAFFADRDRNILILVILWLLMLTAYFSIPLNFLKPKKEHFAFFAQNNATSIFIILIQIMVLSIGVSLINWILAIMYLHEITNQSVVISLINGLLYFGTLLLEYSLLTEKLI